MKCLANMMSFAASVHSGCTIDSPLKGCLARLVSISRSIDGDDRMLNYSRGPNLSIECRVILPPSP